MSLLEARSYLVGDGTEVRRMLPQRVLRTVGAWCFADHYGPDDVTHSEGMRVGPHPHTGLQTVSWLLEGEIVHRDSLGSLQRVGPRQLSLMTSGWGIAHSEESPPDRPRVLSGVTCTPGISRIRSRYSVPIGSCVNMSDEMLLVIAAVVLSTNVLVPVTVTDSLTACTAIFASAFVSCASSTLTAFLTVCMPCSVNVTS